MDNEKPNPLQEARKKAYRQVILDAAERVFAEYGCDAAKMQGIADEAGVAVGTVYSVFGSKSELFSVVLTRRLPELLEMTTSAALSATNTLERLTKGLRAYVVYLLEHPDFLQIHIREHAWGLGPTRATAEQLTAWREGLELESAVLQGAIDEGIVIAEDPVLLARCITAVHQVLLWDWVEKGMQEPVNEVADRMDRLFLQMFCTNQPEEPK
jgi:TetR/AcrR family transcriptional regulator